MGSGRICALSAAVLCAVACAADAGDGPKTDSVGAVGTLEGGTGSSGSSSGGTIGFDSSIVDEPAPAPDGDGSTVLPPSDASTPLVEASPPPPSCTTCPLTVEYYTRTQASPQSINFDIAISNNGTMPQALSELTLRYWFTADGVTNFTGHEYYAAGPILMNVMWTFTPLTATSNPPATATADTYAEVSFSAAAGSIAPMGSTNDIQLEFNDTSYAKTLTEANDYSHTGSDTMSACSGSNNVVTCQSMTITLYRGGTKVWGLEPGMQAPAGDP